MSGLLLTTYIGYRPDTLHKIAVHCIIFHFYILQCNFTEQYKLAGPIQYKKREGKEMNIARGTTDPDPDWGGFTFRKPYFECAAQLRRPSSQRFPSFLVSRSKLQWEGMRSSCQKKTKTINLKRHNHSTSYGRILDKANNAFTNLSNKS